MKTKAVSTRRSFFWKAGATLSAPLALTTARASGSSAEGTGALETRLANLEEVNAIRELHQNYASHINAREHEAIVRLFAAPSEAQIDASIRNLSADDFGEHDVIEVAADRNTATAHFHCTVQTETAIEPSCPLVEMARQQGEGVIRASEKRVLEVTYVKESGAWKIHSSAYAEA